MDPITMAMLASSFLGGDGGDSIFSGLGGLGGGKSGSSSSSTSSGWFATGDLITGGQESQTTSIVLIAGVILVVFLTRSK